jgi:hypothetical protein
VTKPHPLPSTTALVAEVHRDHFSGGYSTCRTCRGEWPCSAVRAADQLACTETALIELRYQVGLARTRVSDEHLQNCFGCERCAPDPDGNHPDDIALADDPDADRGEEQRGSRCTPACGWCGACS